MTAAVTLASMGNGPAFSAYATSGTSMANNTYTKLAFQSKLYDTNSCFDNISNFRFTPTVAGYYNICGAFCAGGGNVSTELVIYKNGSLFSRLNFTSGSGFGSGSYGSTQLYLNGSTDYIELYGKQLSGGTVSSGTGTVDTYFQAAMVRAA